MIDWWVYPIAIGISVIIIFWKEINNAIKSYDESKWTYQDEITKSYIDSFVPIPPITKEDLESVVPTQKTIKLFKCSQCGGILKSSVCDYCGSKYGTITDLKPVPVIPERNTVIMEML